MKTKREAGETKCDVCGLPAGIGLPPICLLVANEQPKKVYVVCGYCQIRLGMTVKLKVVRGRVRADGSGVIFNPSLELMQRVREEVRLNGVGKD